MYLSSGFRVMLASFIIYNGVFTNAKVKYVALKEKYINPKFKKPGVSLKDCLGKYTENQSNIACFVIYSPSKQICGLYVESSCSDDVMASLKNYAKDDSIVYMRTTYTSSSTVDTSSQSPSVAPTVTSYADSSAATISLSTGITFLPQSTLTYISSSDFDLTSTNSDIVVSNPLNHITPTPTSALVTSYQEVITASSETFETTQLNMTELFSDLPEITPSLPTSILMMSSSGTSLVSNFQSSIHDTASEKTSGEITAESSLFTITDPTSSERPDENLCQCKCLQTPLTEQELKKSIARIQKELAVNKSTLSRTIRSKTSAPDHRLSATSIGIIGIVILISFFVFLVVCDLPHLYQHAKKMKQNLCHGSNGN